MYNMPLLSKKGKKIRIHVFGIFSGIFRKKLEGHETTWLSIGGMEMIWKRSEDQALHWTLYYQSDP